MEKFVRAEGGNLPEELAIIALIFPTIPQGIFSADLSPGVEIFTGGQKLYLEVQVESDTLSPREPLNSVVYALVSKKLEDGANATRRMKTANWTRGWTNTTVRPAGSGRLNPLQLKTGPAPARQ